MFEEPILWLGRAERRRAGCAFSEQSRFRDLVSLSRVIRFRRIDLLRVMSDVSGPCHVETLT